MGVERVGVLCYFCPPTPPTIKPQSIAIFLPHDPLYVPLVGFFWGDKSAVDVQIFPP